LTPQTCIHVNLCAWAVASIAYLIHSRARFIRALVEVLILWIVVIPELLSICEPVLIIAIKKAGSAGAHWSGFKFCLYSLPIPILASALLAYLSVKNAKMAGKKRRLKDVGATE
jgi:hypothetical protein